MIFSILFFVSFIISTPAYRLKTSNSCEICIIDATCTDDKISFNVSIKSCENPMNTHFTYYTDVHPKPSHYNTTSSCSDCYITIDIDPVRNAWDYTLTLKLPETSKTCAIQYTAHCTGMFQLSWFILAGLSVLAILLGATLCIATYYRAHTHPKVIIKKKKIDVAVINA